MTQSEWANATNPIAMLEYLRLGHKASDRQRRLFLVACCRRIWNLIADERSQRAVVTAELFAEGQATEEALNTAHFAARQVARAAFDATQHYLIEDDSQELPQYLPGYHLAAATSASASAAWHTSMPPSQLSQAIACMGTEKGYVATAADRVMRAVYHATVDSDESAAEQAMTDEATAQCHILRDICTPFTRPHYDVSWVTPKVYRIAQTILAEGRFSLMPQLADALLLAGCSNDDLVTHCRKDFHVRGCWVVDLVRSVG